MPANRRRRDTRPRGISSQAAFAWGALGVVAIAGLYAVVNSRKKPPAYLPSLVVYTQSSQTVPPSRETRATVEEILTSTASMQIAAALAGKTNADAEKIFAAAPRLNPTGGFFLESVKKLKSKVWDWSPYEIFTAALFVAASRQVFPNFSPLAEGLAGKAEPEITKLFVLFFETLYTPAEPLIF